MKTHIAGTLQKEPFDRGELIISSSTTYSPFVLGTGDVTVTIGDTSIQVPIKELVAAALAAERVMDSGNTLYGPSGTQFKGL
jgi:hypothetical protein